MKKFMAISSLIAVSYCCTPIDALEKIYISPKDILIGENGIFVKIDEFIFQTQEVFSDDIGVFISNVKTWRCNEDACGRDYPKYIKECPWHPKDYEKNENRHDQYFQ